MYVPMYFSDYDCRHGGLVPNNAKSQATTAYKIKTQKMFQNN